MNLAKIVKKDVEVETINLCVIGFEPSFFIAFIAFLIITLNNYK